MKKRLPLVILILSIVVGMLVAVYPLFSNWYSERVSAKITTQYTETIENISYTSLQAEKAAAQKYNESLYAIRLKGDETETLAEYEDILNITDDGVMAYVEIPAIDVNLPVYHTTESAVLDKGVGHMEMTSLPVGGENTHAVISAHTGMAGAKMFGDLELLEVGDIFCIHVLNETLSYEVDKISVTVPADISSIRIEQGKDLCTLVTCTPFGLNTHRLLVRGHRVEYVEEPVIKEAVQEEEIDRLSVWFEQYVIAMMIGIGAAFAVLIVAVILWHTQKERH